ncbi:SDR family NAD(P)-dependent oxidoreductase [Anaeromyxobacter diazotrophicus]|uniref:Ketoacyl reductase n=1 Tax=Anaeromyxobacter diazotrophicus TaxID=2590199 RepID=A0A7I9VQH4_9BACT|nr:SDR family oxidoreductase [Anaeromyxobacter diazotrophicus]GEJ58227.1 ketoacyl reductase [Anaeromyxobacter diazotrophicus]
MAHAAHVRSSAALLGAGLLAGLALARRRRPASLRGACALVTGGSRGLGLLVARELAARGARLVLCARDEEELERARRELERAGAEVLAVACDVSDPAAVERLVARAEARFGPVDVLVNDASIIQVAPAEALSLEDLRAALAVNFWGTVHCTLAVLPGMRARRAGRIVDVTSIGGTVAVPHLLGYSSAKFAAVGFSTGLAAEVGRDGVRVTTVVPGLMRTGSFLHALVKGQRREEARLFAVVSSLPLLTLDAGRAARRIVRACERGERFVTLGWPWKALRVAHALAPGLSVVLLALVSRLLPRAGGERPEAAPDPVWRQRPGRSAATALGDAAAAENNERPAHP